MNIYQKLIEVRKEVPYIQKADQGAQYNYTGSSRVLAAVRNKMDELGLLLVPAVTGHNVIESPIEFKDANGNVTKRTTTYFTEIDMTMTWINADNPEEKITSPWYAQGVDIAGEKGVGKAVTYGEKYFILKFFNIATDKDDPDAFQQKHGDGDEKTPATSGRRSEPSQQRPAQSHQPAANADLAAIENASVQNRSGQGQPSGGAAAARVYALRERVGLSWPDLNVLASNVLGREVKYLKSNVKTEEEWQKIENALKEAS